MIVAAWTVGSLLYAGVALFWMRWLYGHSRADFIDLNPSLGVDYWEDNEAGLHLVLFGAAGVVWPLSLPVLCVVILLAWWMESTPVLSRVELREKQVAMERRIEELEAEKQTWEARNQ